MSPRKKILVIDDDAAVIEFLRAKLADCDIVSTESARDGAALAREHHPDLILCDINMPGFDGGDVSVAVFSEDALRSIPFVYLTAMATPKDLGARGGYLGGRVAVSKHMPPDEPIARIRGLLA